MADVNPHSPNMNGNGKDQQDDQSAGDKAAQLHGDSQKGE